MVSSELSFSSVFPSVFWSTCRFAHVRQHDRTGLGSDWTATTFIIPSFICTCGHHAAKGSILAALCRSSYYPSYHSLHVHLRHERRESENNKNKNYPPSRGLSPSSRHPGFSLTSLINCIVTGQVLIPGQPRTQNPEPSPYIEPRSAQASRGKSHMLA